MADRVVGDRIVPATVRTDGGEPVLPGRRASSGHVDIEFDAVGTGFSKHEPAKSGMTYDHPAFGRPLKRGK